ncbi:TlpA family protein disulfide reductase [Sinomicrobium kalidii]|uniref:TlpA family protein disulfide reductase n=1 Tax=Sinomicrobium kalidii TaxID=2900738 RepID=UPI001E4F60E0|nr:TlpA disulfide reductase family protein [Sinomicrobium kalidii]UGU15477.1 TlpA family protein disulfide reductase [Sinomicrobium kalidii]
MKQLFRITLVLLCCWGCENEQKTEGMILSGSISGNDVPGVIKIRANDYEKDVALGAHGNFIDTLKIERSGYYSLVIGKNNTIVYLKKDGDLYLKADTDRDKFHKNLVYTGTFETANNYLARKRELQDKWNYSQPDKLFVLEEKAFKKVIDVQKETLDSLAEASALPEDFAALEKKGNYYEYAFHILRYPSFHHYFAKKDTLDLDEDFDTGIRDIDFRNEKDFINIPAYKKLVFYKFGEEMNEKYSKNKAQGMESNGHPEFMETIRTYPRGDIKDALLLRNTYYLSPVSDNLEETYRYFMAELQGEKAREKVREKYEKVRKLAKGEPSPGFNYENFKGGTTSLEDLRGKYVYIDIWATWCGPCKAEIPYLKAAEKEYHDKNIVFVSISIDKEEDREKWKSMIEEEQLGGIQLITDKDWKSRFIMDYGIEGIPRFVLIDPRGNIVSADAPRPSSPEMKALLDTIL